MAFTRYRECVTFGGRLKIIINAPIAIGEWSMINVWTGCDKYCYLGYLNLVFEVQVCGGLFVVIINGL